LLAEDVTGFVIASGHVETKKRESTDFTYLLLSKHAYAV